VLFLFIFESYRVEHGYSYPIMVNKFFCHGEDDCNCPIMMNMIIISCTSYFFVYYLILKNSIET